LSSTGVWSPYMFAAVIAAVGVLLVGVGALVACLRLGGLFTRVGVTLDEVDRQIATLSGPVAQTLSHVGGITDTADVTIAKLVNVVGSLETVATNITKTSTLAQEALAPSLVNVGATLTGVTAGLARLTRGKDGAGLPADATQAAVGAAPAGGNPLEAPVAPGPVLSEASHGRA